MNLPQMPHYCKTDVGGRFFLGCKIVKQVKNKNMSKQNTVLQNIISNFDLMDNQHFLDWLKENKKALIIEEKDQIETAFTHGNRQEKYDGTETLCEWYYSQKFINK